MVGKSSLQEIATLEIIREISDSNLETGRYGPKSGVSRLTALHLTAQIIDFRVILGVKTCEVFLCFLVIIFLGAIVLAASLY